MKRLKRLLWIPLLFLCSTLWAADSCEPIQLARMNPYIAGAGAAAAAPGYCDGTTLFCSTFESATSWDATNGTSDCDGYDTDGDYCDGDTTTYIFGVKSLGIRGTTSYYVQKTISNSTEFYIEAWVRWAGYVTNKSMVYLRTSTSSDVVDIYNDADHTLAVKVKDGAVANDSTYSVSANTWYHIGVYYKNETAADNNDGIVRIWANTSTDSGFSVTDIKYSSASVDTGIYTATNVRFVGSASSDTVNTDNFKVVAGAPSWTYE